MSTAIYLENCDSFDYAHAIPSYDGKCSRVHGHTSVVRMVEVKSSVLHDSMVLDLAILKKAVKEVTEHFDHKFIIGEQYIDPEDQIITFVSGGEKHFLNLPSSEVISVEGEATIEVICRNFLTGLILLLHPYNPHNEWKILVTLSEGEGKGATVNYP